MRIRFAVAAVVVVVALETFAGQQPAPQAPPERPFGKGIIEVRVTRAGTTEGIPDVAITLQGPAAVAPAVGQVFTPSSALNPAQRQQIDQLIQSGVSAGAPAETIANAASRMQAQMLGQSPTAALRPADLTGVSDGDGRVNFPNLPPGRYSIRAQREGYYGAVSPGATQPSTIVNGTVTLKDNDDTPSALALEMMRGAVFSGRVRDPEGRPAVGIMVSALQPVYQSGRLLLNTINQSQTDDRGVFRMFWFPPGDYYISATPPQRNIKGNPQETWAKTYFPGVVDTRGAVPFAAAEGAELNGIDFAIRAEATRRISGRIINPFTDADGKPTVPSAAFVLIPQSPVGLFDDTANQSFQNLVPDRSKGEFEIRGVLPGVYDLMVSAPTGTANTPERVVIFNGGTVQFGGASNSIPAWGRVRVDVGREDITNVTVPIKAGLQVRVRVTMDGAPPPYTMAAPPQRGGINTAVLNALVARGISTEEAIAASRAASNAGAPAQVPTPRVRLGLQSKDNAPVAAASSQATFDPSGLYVFPSVPQGSYRMQVNLSGQDQEAYVADIRLGGASIYDDGLFIDGPLPGDIEVAIVSRGSRVQGAVETVESRPGANAVVALVPAENRRQNLTLYKTSRTDAKGNFTLRGVAPGIYKLFAWEDVPNTAWQNAEFLSRYEQLGQTITVMGGESLNTSLKLIPKNYGRP